jgi:hypothetical protein
MKQEHWKEQDVIKAVAAGKNWDQKKHSEECVACTAEERWLQDALTNFRASMHAYAAEHMSTASVPFSQHLQVSLWVGRVGGAVLALLLLFAVPAYRTHQQRAKELREQQDAQLLQQIDEQVSSTVPSALEPLVSAASSTTNQTNPRQEAAQ